MSTTIKTIKSHLTDDIIYPITKSNAVYLPNSTAETVDGHLTDLETLVGSSSITNVGSSITGIIGNNALTTTAQTLSGAVNELNGKISNEYTGNISSSITGSTPTISSIVRIGKNVVFGLRFQNVSYSQSSGINISVANVPSDFRPLGVRYCMGYIVSNNTRIPVMFNIAVDGYIRYTGIASGTVTQLEIAGSYIIGD